MQKFSTLFLVPFLSVLSVTSACADDPQPTQTVPDPVSETEKDADGEGELVHEGNDHSGTSQTEATQTLESSETKDVVKENPDSAAPVVVVEQEPVLSADHYFEAPLTDQYRLQTEHLDTEWRILLEAGAQPQPKKKPKSKSKTRDYAVEIQYLTLRQKVEGASSENLDSAKAELRSFCGAAMSNCFALSVSRSCGASAERLLQAKRVMILDKNTAGYQILVSASAKATVGLPVFVTQDPICQVQLTHGLGAPVQVIQKSPIDERAIKKLDRSAEKALKAAMKEKPKLSQYLEKKKRADRIAENCEKQYREIPICKTEQSDYDLRCYDINKICQKNERELPWINRKLRELSLQFE